MELVWKNDVVGKNTHSSLILIDENKMVVALDRCGFKLIDLKSGVVLEKKKELKTLELNSYSKCLARVENGKGDKWFILGGDESKKELLWFKQVL